MAYFENRNGNGYLDTELNSAEFPMQSEKGIAAFMSKTYGWMSFALVISGLAAWFTGHNLAMQQLLFTGNTVWVLFIAELVLVFALSGAINRLSAAVCTFLFVLYSVVNGLTLGSIFLVYSESSIFSTFLITAILFAAMAVYGYTTKTDLTKFGKMLMFALLGIVIASIVNYFMKSSALEFVVSIVGVIVFVGLTAYDSQKIKMIGAQSLDQEASSKFAIMGALALYLDFINLFLFLLRLLGGRSDD